MPKPQTGTPHLILKVHQRVRTRFEHEPNSRSFFFARLCGSFVLVLAVSGRIAMRPYKNVFAAKRRHDAF
jgi:hypothetical protein